MISLNKILSLHLQEIKAGHSDQLKSELELYVRKQRTEAIESYKKLQLEGDKAKNDYERQVAKNCRSVANSKAPAIWEDSVTGNKLYNKAATEQRLKQYKQ